MPASLTFQGMMAVNPGRNTWVPPVLKLSAPADRVARVRRYTQSGDREPRKCRATKLKNLRGLGGEWGWGGEEELCQARHRRGQQAEANSRRRRCPGLRGTQQRASLVESMLGLSQWLYSASLTRRAARRLHRPALLHWRSARG